MTDLDLRKTFEAYINPIDLDEDLQFVRDGLGREIELNADPELVQRIEVLLQQHFLSDSNFLGSVALMFMYKISEGTSVLTSDKIDALESMSTAKSWKQQMGMDRVSLVGALGAAILPADRRGE